MSQQGKSWGGGTFHHFNDDDNDDLLLFSGLDSSSCSQCVGLLKNLANRQGLTIICTIHQPSALVFEMFDKVYTVVEGHCIYQGPVPELLPFLAEHHLHCPTYHNPADFCTFFHSFISFIHFVIHFLHSFISLVLEVACGEHERNLENLIDAAQRKYRESDSIKSIQNQGKRGMRENVKDEDNSII